MKYPLDIPDATIIKAIDKKFHLNITEPTFVPEGEGSWLYACVDRESKRKLIIKIQEKPFKNESTMYLELFKAGYKWMPQPHLSRKGGIWAKYKGFYYSVQEHLHCRKLGWGK